MSEKNPNQKRHKKKAPQLTEEQKQVVLAAAAKVAEDQKKEQERLNAYGANVKTMSHRQLVGELHRTIRREHAGKPPQPIAGLTIAFATVLHNVLVNTRTSRVFEADEDGKPTRVARLDQINQLGRLYAYPR